MHRELEGIFLVTIVFVAAASAASSPFADWLKALSAPDALVQAPRVRHELEEWMASHPASRVELPEQVDRLKAAIEQLMRSDGDKRFSLGATVINVSAAAPTLSPVADTMDQTEIRERDALRVKDAIDYMAGVSIDERAPRNQSGISIGGFDTRQVPLYLDGLPLYVPFDGYVDLGRYLTSDVAEVQVAKGYSSPMLGPNLLGGVINLVTREPREKIEGDAFIGTAPGKMLNAGLHVGSRWRRFFFQAGLDWMQTDYFPLSGDFRVNAQQPNGQRVNSYQRDERFSGRAAWTPKGQDQNVFSYYNQKGTEGDPPYSGTAPVCPAGNSNVNYACVTPKYWQWPVWNTDSYYFSSNTGIGEFSSFKFRAFYNQFPNIVEMFDDATYSTSYKNASSGILGYNDHSIGASGEFDTRKLPRNAIGTSFFIKDDTRREETTTFSTKNIPSATPQQQDRDQQSSYGVQDVITVTSKIRATAGFSADRLDGLEAQDLSSNKLQVVPFQVAGVCAPATPDSFTSCTDLVWAYNPLASLTYSSAQAGTLFVSFAEKSRFPTLKDRYSYKAGKAVPDPTLLPERAQNWNVGYTRPIASRTVAEIDFFHSNVHDEIENISFLSPLCSGGGKGGSGTCMKAVNVGKETHEGVNFSVRSTALRRTTLDANYSYVNRNIRGTPGIFPYGTPRHKTVGTATVRIVRGAVGILSARYQSGEIGMSDNGLPLPESKFATVDLGASVPIRAGMSLQAGVRNLFDRNYYYWEGFPEEGRNWYFTLRYRF